MSFPSSLRLTASLIVLAVVPMVAASEPDPTGDIEVRLLLYKPGCGGILDDYYIEVTNTSTLYDYKVKRTGTAKIDVTGPQECCDKLFYGRVCGCDVKRCFNSLIECDDEEDCEPGEACAKVCCNVDRTCTNPMNGDPPQFDVLLKYGGCTYNPCCVKDPYETPPFPNCDGQPDACDCDNDTCGDEAWCSTFDDPKVEAVEWRKGEGEWVEYDPPIVICQGMDLDPEGPDVDPHCPHQSECGAGISPAACPGE